MIREVEGKNACWVPGTDHASIATEAKVIKRLKEQGINKSDLTREEFLKHAWEWTDEHGGIILKQLRKLGCSCDWDRTAFTMDETRSRAVIKVFCDLYKKGLIYRGLRIGRLIGGRDHSTVIHSCKKMAQLITSDKTVAENVREIEKLLRTRKDK